MFSGTTDLNLDGVAYNAGRDKDEKGEDFFVLTPIG